ncbi:permease prefix domain 1-containing protein [Paenibacillus sp. Z3-2]
MHKYDRVEVIEDYIGKLVTRLTIRLKDKRDIEEEYRQHLYESYYGRLEGGLSPPQAAEETLRQFGGVAHLQGEINRSYGPAVQHFLLLESFLWIVIMICALLGPYIINNASFQLDHVICPIVYMTLASLFYHLIINKLQGLMLPILASMLAYLYAMYRIFQDTNLWFGTSFIEVSSIFTWGIIHGFWIILCVSHRGKIIKVSFTYWTFVGIALMFYSYLPGPESKLIFLYVMMLYGFLQQWIGSERVWLWVSIFRKLWLFIWRGGKLV